MALRQMRWLNLVVLGFVALLAGFGGAWLHSKTMKPTGTPSLHDRLHSEIKLSSAQDAKLHVIETAFQSQKAELEKEMRLANAELAEAMAADKSYSPKVQLAIDHFHHAMGALQKATVEHVFAMRSILTPEQVVIFDTQVRGALLASSQSGDDGSPRR